MKKRFNFINNNDTTNVSEDFLGSKLYNDNSSSMLRSSLNKND